MIAAIRRWAARHTSERRYSPVGQAFHWTMAALVSFQLGWGWYMGSLPVGGDKLRGYAVHAEIGLLMLVLAGFRLLWRLIVPGPINDADRLGWQTRAAYLTHALFYTCFFGLPLSGWAMWSALGDGAPLAVAGVIPVPSMPFETLSSAWQWRVLDWAEGIHALLIVLLVTMVPIHVGAALKHHFWDRHDVLKGMLPDLDRDDPRQAPRHKQRPPAPPQATAGG